MELNIEISQALEKLRAKYPQETVKLYTAIKSDGTIQHTAVVCGADGYGNREYGWSDTPDGAAESLIRRAGDRNPETIRQAKIAELRKQLADLEAKAEVPEAIVAEFAKA